jgi:hypothetical protein
MCSVLRRMSKRQELLSPMQRLEGYSEFMNDIASECALMRLMQVPSVGCESVVR